MNTKVKAKIISRLNLCMLIVQNIHRWGYHETCKHLDEHYYTLPLTINLLSNLFYQLQNDFLKIYNFTQKKKKKK